MKDVIMDVFAELFKTALTFITSPLKSIIMWAYNFVFGEMNRGMIDALEHPILQAVSVFAQWCCIGVAMASFLFYALKIAQEENRNWAVIFKCFYSTVVFVAGNQILAKICFFIPNLIVSGLSYFVTTVSFEDLLSSERILNLLSGQTILSSVFSLIVLVIAMVGFAVVTIIRVGAIFTQILIAPFYVPAVLMGDSQKWQEWIMSTVAAGFTYVIQHLIFFTGIMVMSYSTNLVIALSLMFGTFGVPKALQRFGWSSGAAHSFQAMMLPTTHIVSSLLYRSKIGGV